MRKGGVTVSDSVVAHDPPPKRIAKVIARFPFGQCHADPSWRYNTQKPDCS
jgi:hypothetical protein